MTEPRDDNNPLRRAIRVLEAEVRRLDEKANGFRYAIGVLRHELGDADGNGEITSEKSNG